MVIVRYGAGIGNLLEGRGGCVLCSKMTELSEHDRLKFCTWWG